MFFSDEVSIDHHLRVGGIRLNPITLETTAKEIVTKSRVGMYSVN